MNTEQPTLRFYNAACALRKLLESHARCGRWRVKDRCALQEFDQALAAVPPTLRPDMVLEALRHVTTYPDELGARLQALYTYRQAAGIDAPSEMVLCWPADQVQFQGVTTDIARHWPIGMGVRLPRSQVEEDTRFKQLVSYVLVLCGDNILAYPRGGSEARLNSFWSIGVGGHINETDYKTGMIRELWEETGLSVGKLPVAGLINDDTVPVGRTHLGVLHVLRVEQEHLPGGDIKASRFLSIAEAADKNLEPWSKTALNWLKNEYLAK